MPELERQQTAEADGVILTAGMLVDDLSNTVWRVTPAQRSAAAR